MVKTTNLTDLTAEVEVLASQRNREVLERVLERLDEPLVLDAPKGSQEVQGNIDQFLW